MPEERFQVGQHFVAAAHQFHHAGHIVGHKPSLLIGITFHAAVPFLQTAVLRPVSPRPVGVAHPEPSFLLVENPPVGLAAPFISHGIGRLSQCLGPLAHTPVEIAVLQRFGNTAVAGRIAQFRMMTDTVGRPTRKTVGFFHVVTSYAFLPGIHDHGNGRITQHAAAIGVQELPAFVDTRAVLLCQCDKRIDDVVHNFGVYQILQGELASEHIPSAEHGTFLERTGLVHLKVAAHVFARHIAIIAGIYHGMIQRRIEYDTFVFRASGYSDFRQRFVPHGRSPFAISVKVTSAKLSPEIGLRPLHADKRDGRAHQHLLPPPSGKLGVESQVVALHQLRTLRHFCPAHHFGKFRRGHILQFAAHPLRNIGRPYTVILQRTAEARIEINRIIGFSASVAPASAIGGATHPSADSMVVHTLHTLPDGRAPYTACQINLYPGAFTLRISEPHHSAMRRGRQLGPDVIVCEMHGIVSRSRLLALLVVARTVSVLRPVGFAAVSMQRPHRRHHQEVSQITVPPYAAHLRHGKSLYRSVLKTISRPIVASGNRIRTHLCHSPRRGRSGERLPQAVLGTRHLRVCRSTDKRIHIFRPPLFAADLHAARQHQRRKPSGHTPLSDSYIHSFRLI